MGKRSREKRERRADVPKPAARPGVGDAPGRPLIHPRKQREDVVTPQKTALEIIQLVLGAKDVIVQLDHVMQELLVGDDDLRGKEAAMQAEELTAEFGIAGVLDFVETEHGLVKAVILLDGITCELYLQGAHLTAWQPPGERPILFTSPNSAFAPGRAIRGGIPIIFPWFGANRHEPAAPQHGFARTAPWRLNGVETVGRESLTLTLASSGGVTTATVPSYHPCGGSSTIASYPFTLIGWQKMYGTEGGSYGLYNSAGIDRATDHWNLHGRYLRSRGVCLPR